METKFQSKENRKVNKNLFICSWISMNEFYLKLLHFIFIQSCSTNFNKISSAQTWNRKNICFKYLNNWININLLIERTHIYSILFLFFWHKSFLLDISPEQNNNNNNNKSSSNNTQLMAKTHATRTIRFFDSFLFVVQRLFL